jgi:hypothetical protein
LEYLSIDELQEWEAFDALEPVGVDAQRMEHMFGVLCALIVNLLQQVMGKKGSSITPILPTEFIPKWGVFENEVKQLLKKEKPQQSLSEMKELLLSIARAQNAKYPGGRRQRKPKCPNP